MGGRYKAGLSCTARAERSRSKPSQSVAPPSAISELPNVTKLNAHEEKPMLGLLQLLKPAGRGLVARRIRLIVAGFVAGGRCVVALFAIRVGVASSLDTPVRCRCC